MKRGIPLHLITFLMGFVAAPAWAAEQKITEEVWVYPRRTSFVEIILDW